MTKITTSQFQKGIFIEFKGEPHLLVDFQFVAPGKGSAFVRTKLKRLATNKVQEFTFKSGEEVTKVPIIVREMQYLYRQADSFIFMDKTSFEQTSLDKNILATFSQFLKEGETYQILLQEDKAVGIRYPKKVKLTVTEADEGAKGDTVMAAKKIVTLETGVKIAVPLFIKKGDQVAINPETGEYLERVNP